MQKWHTLFHSITRHSYATSLILLIHTAIAFALSSVTGFPTAKFWWLPALPSPLAETQSPILPTLWGSWVLHLLSNILKKDNTGRVKSIASQSSCFVDLTHLYFLKFVSSGKVFSHDSQTVVNPAEYPPQLPDILCCTDEFSLSSHILLEIILPFERMWCWIQISHQAVSGSVPLWCVLFQQPGGLEVSTKALLTTAAFR